MEKSQFISISSTSCIGCERCVKICTSKIFYVDPTSTNSSKKNILMEDMELCIRCGHCVAVCPTDAITHEDFPKHKIHPFKKDILPTAEQVLNLIKTRRSNRAFTDKEIPQDYLEKIIEAAHRAPTASNSQLLKMILLVKQDNIRELSMTTITVFGSLIKKLDNPLARPLLKPFLSGVYKLIPKFKKMEAQMYEGKEDLILRGAKAVLLFYTPKENRFGSADANLAYQNASLMAESLGVAHFYTGFVCAAYKQNSKKFNEFLGIDGCLQAGMAMGIPDFTFNAYIDRKDLDIKYL